MLIHSTKVPAVQKKHDINRTNAIKHCKLIQWQPIDFKIYLAKLYASQVIQMHPNIRK